MTGGCYLSGSAGYINAITLDGIFHTAVSHVTGRTTTASMHAAHGNWEDAGFDAGLLVTFLLGAMASQMMIGSIKFALTKRYGVVLMIESALLLAASTLFQYDNVHLWKFAMCILSAACGLQNGMTTFFSGAIIRTTHVTGTLTDIGLLTGARICGRRKDEWWKLKVFIPLYVSFFVGGVIGARMALDYDALWFPAVAFAGVGGLHYMTVVTVSGVQSIHKSFEERRARRRRRALEALRQINELQKEEQDEVDGDDSDDEEAAAAIRAALEAGMAAAAHEIAAGNSRSGSRHNSIRIDVNDPTGAAHRSFTRRSFEQDAHPSAATAARTSFRQAPTPATTNAAVATAREHSVRSHPTQHPTTGAAVAENDSRNPFQTTTEANAAAHAPATHTPNPFIKKP